MSTNCRFAFGVHVMTVLALAPEEFFSSERLAVTVNTNPVIIRRLLLDLKEASLVDTHRGPGGGAILSKPAEEITLLDIYRAVSGEVEPFGEHPNEPNRACTVGREIKRVLEDVANQARIAVECQYGSISLQDVLQDLNKPS